jgi:prepilin-type N-terminal cleavage/methylation domain-containing protein
VQAEKRFSRKGRKERKEERCISFFASLAFFARDLLCGSFSRIALDAFVSEAYPAPMARPNRPAQGFTRLELIVVLVLIAIFVSLAIPAITDRPVHPDPGLVINNARQIHLAVMCMATDGDENHDPALGWPGDLKRNGRIANLSDFVNGLVRNDYLKPNDLKIFSGPGFKPYQGKLRNGVLDPPFTEENCTFKIYLAKDSDTANTLLLATKNYTYNTPLKPNAKPFGDKGFIVMRKGGEVALLKGPQAQKLPGNLPGGGTVESAENCLNPGP